MPKRFFALICVFFLGISPLLAADASPTADQLQSSEWWLERASRFADLIADGEDRTEAFYKLTYALANRGEFGRAMMAAEEVAEPQVRVYSFSRIAKLADQAGDDVTCTKALAVARDVAIPAQIGQTNAHMVRLYFELDRQREALPFADALPHQTQRFNAISNVAEGYARAGNVDKAMEIVRVYLPPTWLDTRRVVVARACADGKHFDKAVALAESIETLGSRDSAYDQIAELLISDGQFERGKEILQRIQDARRRDERLAQFASASVGSAGGAKSVAKALQQASTREEKTSLGMLRITELVQEGKVDEAEALIESLAKIVEGSPRQPQVSKFGTFDDAQIIALIKANYLDTALIFKQSGDAAAAKQRIEKAVAAAKAIKSQGLGKMMIDKKLIQGLNALGENEIAKELIGHQDTPFTKATSSADIAASLILAGKIDEGLKMAGESVADRSMAYGTRRVAIALLTIRRFDELAKYMAKMPDNKREVRAFREIAQEMVKTNHSEQLNDLLDDLPSDAARTQACLGAYDMLRPKEQGREPEHC